MTKSTTLSGPNGPKYYNGKYPNRIESVWQIPERFDARRPWVLRTNIGAIYTFTPNEPLISSHDIVGRDIETVSNRRFRENSERLKPGPKHRVKS